MAAGSGSSAGSAASCRLSCTGRVGDATQQQDDPVRPRQLAVDRRTRTSGGKAIGQVFTRLATSARERPGIAGRTGPTVHAWQAGTRHEC
jgi:hypothetical protein